MPLAEKVTNTTAFKATAFGTSPVAPVAETG